MSKTRRNHNITRKNRVRGWSKQQPGTHQRTIMMHKCGKKCFLGPNKTFPICTKNTCNINKKGILSAYIRAREYTKIKKTKKYRQIAKKAYRILHK